MLFRSVWDARSGDTVVGPFQGHTGSVRSVAFSQDGTRIVSASSDHTIRVWDAWNNDPIFVLNQDGWITTQNNPFFCISLDFRRYLPVPTNMFVIGPQGNVLVDYCSHLNIGEMWPLCLSS